MFVSNGYPSQFRCLHEEILTCELKVQNDPTAKAKTTLSLIITNQRNIVEPFN